MSSDGVDKFIALAESELHNKVKDLESKNEKLVEALEKIANDLMPVNIQYCRRIANETLNELEGE